MNGRLSRGLELIAFLLEGRGYSTDELAQRLYTSRRNVAYDIEALRENGFNIEKVGTRYYIEHFSPFVLKLRTLLTIAEAEARNKGKEDGFRFLIDFAIRNERIVILKGYTSPNSLSVRDRLVEPYYVSGDEKRIRCFELNSHCNKTYNLSRISSIELTEVGWIHKKRHRADHTDIFGFSSTEVYSVEVLMRQRAVHVLEEEYPLMIKEGCISPLSHTEPQSRDGHYSHLLSLKVASYVGIGRFVLGMADEVRVVGNEGFIVYLRDKVQKLYQSLH